MHVRTHTSTVDDDDDYILLRHPLIDASSIPSTISDISDLSSAVDHLSLSDPSNADSDSDDIETGSVPGKTRSRAHSSDITPTASYEDASAFISSFISSPDKGNGAGLDLLRALIVELGLRPPNASDLPDTLTSARKVLKAEAHVNIKEYIATRHGGPSALREILKPSKNALRKEIRKGKSASLQWVKQHGLQVLLITCFA